MHSTRLRPTGPGSRPRSARPPHPGRAMRARRWLPLLTLALGACDALPTGPERGPAFDQAPALSREATDRINEHRASLGCEALRWHGSSAAVGEQYAKRMSDAAFFGHVDPSGSTLKSRLERAGIFGYRVAAETIAAGQRTAPRVVADWILSRDHRAILEDCRFTHVGIGVYTGDGPYHTYWTAVFLAAP